MSTLAIDPGALSAFTLAAAVFAVLWALVRQSERGKR